MPGALWSFGVKSWGKLRQKHEPRSFDPHPKTSSQYGRVPFWNHVKKVWTLAGKIFPHTVSEYQYIMLWKHVQMVIVWQGQPHQKSPPDDQADKADRHTNFHYGTDCSRKGGWKLHIRVFQSLGKKGGGVAWFLVLVFSGFSFFSYLFVLSSFQIIRCCTILFH